MRPFSRLRRQLPQRGSQETCFPLRGKSREAGMGVNLRRSRGPQLSYLDSIFENPVIVIYQKDLSTRRSCSDFYGQCQLACFHPWGSVSLDSRSPAAPYESSSLATARDAAVLQRTAEPGLSWRFYCTLKRLPLGARPTGVWVESIGMAT